MLIRFTFLLFAWISYFMSVIFIICFTNWLIEVIIHVLSFSSATNHALISFMTSSMSVLIFLFNIFTLYFFIAAKIFKKTRSESMFFNRAVILLFQNHLSLKNTFYLFWLALYNNSNTHQRSNYCHKVGLQ